jgi:hypothetical protein
MPAQASLAAGVLQTGRSLSIPIGLAITFAVYGSIGNTEQGESNPRFQYYNVYICTAIFAAVSLLCVPFMKIKRHSNNTDITSIHRSSTAEVHETERPGAVDGTADCIKRGQNGNYTTVKAPSGGSISSAATAGSYDPYFPRWSWEGVSQWPEGSHTYPEENFVYEVCIKCLQERGVFVEGERERYRYQDEIKPARPSLMWDVESQYNECVDLTTDTLKEIHGYPYLDGARKSKIPSRSSLFPDSRQTQTFSSNACYQSVQDWIFNTVERSLPEKCAVQGLWRNSPHRRSSNNPYLSLSDEIKNQDPIIDEGVFICDHLRQSMNLYQCTQSSRIESYNEYGRILVPHPHMSLSPLVCRLPNHF